MYLKYTLLFLMILWPYGETCEVIQWKKLTNCSFVSHANPLNSHLLTMIVPYALNVSEENHLLISILRHPYSLQPLIQLNLNLIQCNQSSLSESSHWNSLESSSTLNGEFVRTNRIVNNRMYLPSGLTYLRNLTMIDCSTKTIYQSDVNEIFQLDLRIESTLNDSCQTDEQCYPHETYRCDIHERRCTCRDTYQTYKIENRLSICIETVETMADCQQTHVRCFPWCRGNNTSSLCACPENISDKVLSLDHRAYCQSRTNQICNPILQCSSTDQCRNGYCRSRRKTLFENSLIIGCSILCLISLILALLLCFFRCRQRTNSDRIAYESFRPKATSSSSYSYQPTVVYLGGEQQLTAIFA